MTFFPMVTQALSVKLTKEQLFVRMRPSFYVFLILGYLYAYSKTWYQEVKETYAE